MDRDKGKLGLGKVEGREREGLCPLVAGRGDGSTLG